MERIKMVLDHYRYQIIISLGGILILMVIGMFFLAWNVNNQSNFNQQSLLQTSSNQVSTGDNSSVIVHESSSTQQFNKNENNGYVDLKGAVKRPGIYQINSEMRVDELIKMAGGLKENADLKNVNLAQKLVDQQVIYITKKGEKTDNITTNDNVISTSHSDTGGGQININTADVTQMQQITGIGKKRAEQIIAYRDEHGPFKQIEDIKNVSGFGDKMFENMKTSITV